MTFVFIVANTPVQEPAQTLETGFHWTEIKRVPLPYVNTEPNDELFILSRITENACILYMSGLK